MTGIQSTAGANAWLDRVAYAVGLSLIPTMVLELMVLAPSLTSIAVTAVFVALRVARGPRLVVTGALGLHLLAIACFVVTAVAQPQWGVAEPLLLDFLQAAQAIIAVPLLAGFLAANPAMGRRFLPDTARLLLAIGAAAAAAGLAKLALLSQGVLLENLFLDDGRYPAGTALQHDYNLYALGLLVCLAFGLWLTRAGSTRPDRLLAFVAVPLISIAVALSTSRRGFLLLVAILGVHLATVVSTSRRARVAGALFAILAGGAIAVTLGVASGAIPIGGAMQDRLDLGFAVSRLLGVASADDLFSTRAPLFGYAWTRFTTDMSAAALIFGNGMTYLTEMGRVFDNPTGFEYPHNFLLSALLHGGLLLAGLMVLLVGSALGAAWRGRGTCSAVLTALLVGLVFALSSSRSLYTHELLYFLLVAAVVPAGLLPRPVPRPVRGSPALAPA